MTIRIHSDPLGFGGLAVARRSAFSQSEIELFVARLVENPDRLTWGHEIVIQEPVSPFDVAPEPASDGSYVDCVIIAGSDALGDYQDYADFRTERGVVTVVRGAEWIHAHERFRGRDKAESIRNFLKAAYEEWGTTFAVLAGWQIDPAQETGLPSRYVPYHIKTSLGLTTTDHYFADLDGSWNEDGDEIFGEPYLIRGGTSSMFWTDEVHGRATIPQSFPFGTVGYWTDDGGETWHLSNTNPGDASTEVLDMYFTDLDCGWCVGSDCSGGSRRVRIYSTTDGGRNWRDATPGNAPSGFLWSVHFIDQEQGWAVGGALEPGGEFGLIAHTTDAGLNWAFDFQPAALPNLDVEFSSDGASGWIASDGNYVIRTTDCGAHWYSSVVPDYGAEPVKVKCVGFADADRGWAGGTSLWSQTPLVWYTANGGQDWADPERVGRTSRFRHDLQAMTDPEDPEVIHAWAAGRDEVHYFESRSALWREVARRSQIHNVQFLTPFRGWVGRQEEPLLSTTDGGTSWLDLRPGLHVGDVSMASPMPEIFVARLPCVLGSSDASSALGKLRRYQDSPASLSPDYLRNFGFLAAEATLVGSDVTANPLLVHEAAQLTEWWQDRGLFAHELYLPKSGNGWNGEAKLTRQAAIDHVNGGLHFLCHFNHSNFCSWQCEHSDDKIADADFLPGGPITNGDTACIAMAAGCSGLLLDGSRSIGRQSMVCPSGGAVAYGGSSVVNFATGYPLHLHLLAEVYGYGNRLTRIGPAYSCATTCKRGAERERIYENLLGDPLMDIWTDIPGRFLVAGYEDHLAPEPQVFTVVVTDEQEFYASGATVCLSMRNPTNGSYNVYHVGTTGPDGQVQFNIDPKETGELVVTVTKHNYLPFKDTCHVGLFTNDPQATANNQQRHIARVVGTTILHLVYTDDGNILHTVSYDGGEVWARPDVIDAGQNPTITLNYSQSLLNIPDGSGVVRDAPWVAYKQGDDIKVAIIREGQPPLILTAFDGSAPDSVVGPPAFAASPTLAVTDPSAWIAYVVSYLDAAGLPTFSVQARLLTESNVMPAYVISGPDEPVRSCPTLAITPGGANVPGDVVHVAWQQENNTTGSAIVYSEYRAGRVPPWTPPSPVCPNELEPRNPFIEAEGEWVRAAWSAQAGFGKVKYGNRWVPGPIAWSDPREASGSPGDRPVLSTMEVIAWQEDGEPEGGIWAWIHGEYCKISNTELPSAHPSIDVKITLDPLAIVTYAVWTGEVEPGTRYEVMFNRFNWMPSDLPGQNAPRHLAIQTGDSIPSPYCLRRTGAVRYGTYALDFSRDSLKYRLPCLDPQYDYSVRAVVYQLGSQRWTQRMRLGGSLSWNIGFDPGCPETLWAQIPSRSYRLDGEALLTATRLVGQFSVVTEFAVYQAEPSRGRDVGGKPSAGTASESRLPLRAVLEAPRPNPSAGGVTIRYSLNSPTTVSLAAFDAAGRHIRTLACGEQRAGLHSIRWDRLDNRRGRVAGGIYFVKFAAGSAAAVRKLVLLD